MRDNPPGRRRRSHHRGVCSVPSPGTPRSLCTRFSRTRRIGRRRRRTPDTPARPGTPHWSRPRSDPPRPCRGPGRGTAPSSYSLAVPGRRAGPLASSAAAAVAALRAALPAQGRSCSRPGWARERARRRAQEGWQGAPHSQASVARPLLKRRAQPLRAVQARRTRASCRVSSSLRPPLLTRDPASEAPTGQRSPSCASWNLAARRRVASVAAEPGLRIARAIGVHVVCGATSLNGSQ